MKYVTLHTKWTLQITDPGMERLPWIIQVMQSQGPLLVKALLSQTPMIVILPTKGAENLSLLLEHSRHPKSQEHTN